MGRGKLPEEFVKRMERMLPGNEWEDYLKSFGEKAYSALRVNTLKVSPEQFQKLTDWKLERVLWTENGFYYETEEDSPSKHPFYYAGLYYLQEPSAMAPAQILPIEPGDHVLDLCAAPGGKTTELGARLKGRGVLVCNDISASRAKALLKNIELFGITNAIVLNETPDRIRKNMKGYFDKILIDAPCSGEGMFRKEASMMKSWEENGPLRFAKLQSEILSCVPELLKPGGMLLYSTCTFSPEEDEEQVKSLLDTGEFELVDIRSLPIYKENHLEELFDTGHPEWSEDEGTKCCAELSGCVRLFPHKLRGEGHFVALLRKKRELGNKESLEYQGLESKGKKKEPSVAEEFLSMVKLDDGGQFVMGNENLYYIPDDFPTLDGLHVIRSGLLLGTVKSYAKATFEPAQSLAMALDRESFSNYVDFKVTDERVVRFLKGETIELSGKHAGEPDGEHAGELGGKYAGEPDGEHAGELGGKHAGKSGGEHAGELGGKHVGKSGGKHAGNLDGWCLVTVEGYPLGFGKVTGDKLKNKYNKGWRML